MKVIVPLAGPETEVEKTFGDFKNLINVYGRPLIKYVAEKRPYDLSKAVFILSKKTNKKYAIAPRLKKVFGRRIEIFILDKITEGAPCSVLEYLKESNVNGDILIDLIDQHLDLGSGFISFVRANRAKVNGIIPTFKSKYWKWSYVKLDKEGFVTMVKEKVNPPISGDATAGVYYFSSAKDFMVATEQMICLNKRVEFNNKFFISCVYNEFPRKTVLAYPVKIVCPLGSVDGIRTFLKIT
jgi:dTDP-glucose pyrophosphorylase